MNLHDIAKGAVEAVNPRRRLLLQRSTGYTTDSTGRRTPAYDPPQPVWCQVQPLTFDDVQQTNGLNIQGTKRAIYLDGNWHGLVRSEQKGGDLITFEDGSVWLVVLVVEHWPGWTKVVVTLQMDGGSLTNV